jgi:hypothetical protein
MRWSSFLVAALLVTPAWADQHQKFSQQKWLDAPGSGKDWSRADMELPNMTGWTRARVIKLLGEPGMTYLEIDPSAPDENSRLDTYLLNEENHRSLEINYDALDVVKYAGESNGCKCPTCPETPREVSMDKIKNFAPNLAKRPTIRDAEAMLGTGNLHVAISEAGLFYTTHYTVSWRVTENERMYLFLGGHAASKDVATIDLRDAKLGRSYRLTELWPDCLPREESKFVR